MSVAQVTTAYIRGITARKSTVEVDVARGLYQFVIVGLGERSVEESKERVLSALSNALQINPKSLNQKIVVSLTPGDEKKDGSHFDVPIAIGYLAATKYIPKDLSGKLFVGELSLTGDALPMKGILAVAKYAKEASVKELYVPECMLPQTALVQDVTILGYRNLKDLVDHLQSSDSTKTHLVHQEGVTEASRPQRPISHDISSIVGQDIAKRALLIAAHGRHNIALYGPPGTGKTMLAKAFVDLLPELSPEEKVEVALIHSLVQDPNLSPKTQPPFRQPHHTSSYVSLVGGGQSPRPGEVTLAHRGVLFLDEFPEFDQKTIEALREPLEEGFVTVSRARGAERFPASCITIIAMNPCPCGYATSSQRPCKCSQRDLLRYRRKLTGPLVDRIDLWVPVEHIAYEKLSHEHSRANTKAFRSSLERAHRWSFNNGTSRISGQLTGRELEEGVNLTEEARVSLHALAKRSHISPRLYHKILRIGRTIADLSESKEVNESHIFEAFQYRPSFLE